MMLNSAEFSGDRELFNKNIRPLFEPRCEKTGLRDFRPGPTQTGLCSHRRCLKLEISDLESRGSVLPV